METSPLSSTELASRLRQAREAQDMTQAQVAEHLGLARNALTQIEAGQRQVTGFELERLARLYGRRVEDFFHKEFAAEAELSAMFRTQLGVEPNPILLEAIGTSAELNDRLGSVEAALGIPQLCISFWPRGLWPMPQNKHDAVQSGLRAAEEERRRMGLGLHPLPDLTDLLEARGVRTLFATLPDGVDGFTLQGGDARPCIVVTDQVGAGRTRFNLAHEYGHVVMDGNMPSLLARRSNRTELPEIRANAFAAAFMMPEEGVKGFLGGLGRMRRRNTEPTFDESGVDVVRNLQTGESSACQPYDVVLVAAYFGTSLEAALYRLATLDYLNQPERERLQVELDVQGAQLERLLHAPDAVNAERQRQAVETSAMSSKRRVLGLLFEALRREEVSPAWARETLLLAGLKPEEVEQVIVATSPPELRHGVVLPEAN